MHASYNLHYNVFILFHTAAKKGLKESRLQNSHRAAPAVVGLERVFLAALSRRAAHFVPVTDFAGRRRVVRDAARSMPRALDDQEVFAARREHEGRATAATTRYA